MQPSLVSYCLLCEHHLLRSYVHTDHLKVCSESPSYKHGYITMNIPMTGQCIVTRYVFILFSPFLRLNVFLRLASCGMWLLSSLHVPTNACYRIMDALHLSLTIHAVYHYLVNSFGQFLALNVVVWYVPGQTFPPPLDNHPFIQVLQSMAISLSSPKTPH